MSQIKCNLNSDFDNNHHINVECRRSILLLNFRIDLLLRNGDSLTSKLKQRQLK